MALTTDTAPRIQLSPAQVLQDPHRMKRLKAALSQGIFRYADDEAAGRIIDASFQICGGSSDTVFQVLQTKFFADHTPLYWTIINRHSMPGTPPLLTRLLAACNPLSRETQDDIIDALYREYDSDLYCAIKDCLPDVLAHEAYSVSEFFNREEDRPKLTASSVDADVTTATINFKVPRFFGRLLIDEEMTFEFLLIERLWRLKMKLQEAKAQTSSHRRWFFELSEVRCKNGYEPGRLWEITIDIVSAERKVRSWRFCDSWLMYKGYYADVISDKPRAVQVPDDHLARLLCNPYMSNKMGEFSGTINLTRRS